jgi:hypothetical protein
MALEVDFPPMTGDGPITKSTRSAIMVGTIPLKDAKKLLLQARYEDWKNSQNEEKQCQPNKEAEDTLFLTQTIIP